MNGKPISLLLPALALLAGCGGTDHRSASTTEANPFAGAYTGTYDAPFLGDNGTFDPSVSPTGAVTGTSHSNGANADGTITGQISADGAIQGTIQYPGAPLSNLSGTLTKGANGSVSGTVTQTFGNSSGDVTISLTLTPP